VIAGILDQDFDQHHQWWLRNRDLSWSWSMFTLIFAEVPVGPPAPAEPLSDRQAKRSRQPS
jgi:hypothetical protein